MLNIYFGNYDDAVYDTNTYFNNTYKDSWITKDLSMQIIKDIDKSDVIDGNSIKSPIFNVMSPKQLSGGAKTLILVANNRNKVFNVSTCGDNCAKWLLKIADEKAITVNLRHIMNFGNNEFKIKIKNTNKIVKNMEELIKEAGDLV